MTDFVCYCALGWGGRNCEINLLASSSTQSKDSDITSIVTQFLSSSMFHLSYQTYSYSIISIASLEISTERKSLH